jgi:hypothetical protein
MVTLRRTWHTEAISCSRASSVWRPDTEKRSSASAASSNSARVTGLGSSPAQRVRASSGSSCFTTPQHLGPRHVGILAGESAILAGQGPYVAKDRPTLALGAHRAHDQEGPDGQPLEP